MVGKIETEDAAQMQFDLQITLRKVASVVTALAGEMERDEREWYMVRLGELGKYRDELIAELDRRGEATDVRGD